jgi:hypothetical protein
MEQGHQPPVGITAHVWINDPMLQHPTRSDRDRPKQAESHQHVAILTLREPDIRRIEVALKIAAKDFDF